PRRGTPAAAGGRRRRGDRSGGPGRLRRPAWAPGGAGPASLGGGPGRSWRGRRGAEISPARPAAAGGVRRPGDGGGRGRAGVSNAPAHVRGRTRVRRYVGGVS